MIAFANQPPHGKEFVHPLVKAAILHFWLAYEHPFVDGNGRTARALFYWFMLKSGYWLFEFLTISRIIADGPMRYYRSFLHSEHDDNDLTYSIMCLLDVTNRSLRALRKYLAEKQAEQKATAIALSAFPDLNDRQRAIIANALTHADEVYTFLSHRESHGISQLTARSDLIELARKGLLMEGKLGRQRCFFPAVDLAKKLLGKPEKRQPKR
jgi:Fic family protein